GLADRAVLQQLQRTLGRAENRLLPFKQQNPKVVELLRRHVFVGIGRRVVWIQRAFRLGQNVDLVIGNRRHSPTPPSDPAIDRSSFFSSRRLHACSRRSSWRGL